MSDQPPIRKTQARIAERERERAEEHRKGMMSKFIPLTVVFLVAGFVIFVGSTTLTKTSSENIQGTTGPRFQVDREKIEMGKQIFNNTVRAAFTVKNVGDGTLKLDAPKVATVVDGC
jgi:archaellum component FlaG (FlaF/FlaG flagellin family)